MAQKLISIVIPAMNEEANLDRCYEELSSVMRPLACDYEVLLIDNDSTDRTPEISAEIARRDHRWRYIKFSRNFTGEISMAAGFYYSRGDAVVVLFSDLQEPPSLIPAFIEKWREGYDIVYGIHTKRHGDSAFTAFLVSVYYRLIRKLSDYPLPEHVGDFSLLDRKVVNVVNQMRERNRYLRGLMHWTGFKRFGIPYERRARRAGRSKAPFFYMLSRAFAAIVNFSTKPLRMFMVFGMSVLSLAMIWIIVLIALKILSLMGIVSVVPGLATTHALLLLNLGVISLGFGVLGEYIGHIYNETKRRPLWVVERTINLELSETEKIIS